MAVTYDTTPLTRTGVVDFTGNTLNVHTVETTQRHALSRRYLTWDGKVFRYAKSGGSCYTGKGNIFNNTISSSANGIDYSVLAASAGAGDTLVKMTNSGASDIAENALAGGQIVLKPTETYTDGQLMFRGITGNSSAVATSGTCTIYLDDPIETALTTSNYAFAMPSPYSNIKYEVTSGTKSFAGIAAGYVSAANYYFWLQTYGACWLAPQSRCGTTAYYRTVYWRHDGSVDIHTQLGSYVTDQVAGFIVDNNADNNGSTVIFLTVSI
jgi:hypothetical protein